MIRTKHLVEFMRGSPLFHDTPLTLEYRAEIVARLEAFDKLKESIGKLLATVSGGVDK